MQQILDRYASHILNERGFTPATVDKYIGNLHIIFRKLEIKSLADFDPAKISQEWQYVFWDTVQAGRRLADATRRSYLVALKSFLLYLEEHGYPIPRGTAANIRLPRPTEVFYEGLNKDEQKKLREYLCFNLKSIVQLRNTALIFFLWSTGCRISEALQLNVHADGYIYTDDPTMRSGDFEVNGKDVYVEINGKGKKHRKIVVTPEAVAYINFYLEQRWQREKIKSPILFLNHYRRDHHTRLSRTGSYSVIMRVLEAAGIDKPRGLGTHLLRYTAIDTWVDMGLPITQIIAMTGHSSSETLDHYIRRRKERTRIFAREANAIRTPTVDKEIGKFEDILIKRYVRTKD